MWATKATNISYVIGSQTEKRTTTVCAEDDSSEKDVQSASANTSTDKNPGHLPVLGDLPDPGGEVYS